jgi:Tfp pilus assembly protein PilW
MNQIVRPRHGYSLVELLIGFTVAIIVLLLLFEVFQSNTELARSQIDVADMQQSQRVVQHEMVRLVRMTGRGGLPHMVDRGNGTRYLPALTVRDNVASGQNIAVGDASSPAVAEGTDVLTIRGVFNSPVYQLNFADPNTLRLYDANNNQTSHASQAILRPQ